MQDTGERVGEGADSEDSDLSFVRTVGLQNYVPSYQLNSQLTCTPPTYPQEDIICLACTNGDSIRRGYLSAKGFGSQLCHLVPEPLKQASLVESCSSWLLAYWVSPY